MICSLSHSFFKYLIKSLEKWDSGLRLIAVDKFIIKSILIQVNGLT